MLVWAALLSVQTEPDLVCEDVYPNRVRRMSDEQPPCGQWVDCIPQDGIILAWECRGGDDWELKRTRRRHTTREACAEWCESRHPERQDGWCCEYLIRVQKNGVVGPATCSWSNGDLYLRKFSALQFGTSAYTLCPTSEAPTVAHPSAQGRARAHNQSRNR